MTTSDVAPRRTQRLDRPAKGDLRERALIAAAERLLASGEFARASVADLAGEAQISRAAFYFYFSSKQALLASVIDRSVAEFNARILAMLAPEADQSPRDALQATVEAAADLWWEHRTVLTASFELGVSLPEVYDRSMANMAVVRVPTVELLRRHGRVPEANDQDAATGLVTILTLMSERNFYDLLRRSPTRAEWAQLTDRLTRIWVRAFGLDS